VAAIKHANPVGTPEELKKNRMPLNAYGSCAKRERNAEGDIEVLGCQHYGACQFIKGGDVPKDWQNIRDHGPEHVPVRIVSDNGGVVERALPCYDYIDLNQRYNDIPDSGGACEVISGKQYLARGSRPKTITENGKAITSHVDFAELTEVEAFPRPGKNPQFLGDAFAAQSKVRAAEERRARARDDRLGVSDVADEEAEES
jgi:hypothetical protein